MTCTDATVEQWGTTSSGRYVPESGTRGGPRGAQVLPADNGCTGLRVAAVLSVKSKKSG